MKKHQVPKWYHDAKLGIFIHWGLFSVPAHATTEAGSIRESIKKGGWEYHYKYNPYAEWYLNTMKIKDSPTQKYHMKKYGADFSYETFSAEFNKAITRWDPNKMADLFQKIGARYVVLVTKHADGFLLWPSKYQNPNRENYIAKRDIVGELTNAVKKLGMRMGFYYTGALDWSFNEVPIQDFPSMVTNGPIDPEYAKYVNNHFRELIDRYKPSILWNDIGYPPNTNIYDIIAYFYNKIPDGLVNDRWGQTDEKLRKLLLSNIDYFSDVAKQIFLEEDFNKITLKPPHYDFRTPEYSTFKKISKEKFEVCRGIGNSFGYNQEEGEKEYISVNKLVRIFVDIVSKNGNLLLNVGPMVDGTIPDLQVNRLLGLGKWLETNGEAIFETRPWIRAEGRTIEGIDVRFTQKDDVLYVILFDTPKKKELTIEALPISKDSIITLLGNSIDLTWKQLGNDLAIKLPEKLHEAPAHSFKIVPKP